jgi:hypothetical protein
MFNYLNKNVNKINMKNKPDLEALRAVKRNQFPATGSLTKYRFC